MFDGQIEVRTRRGIFRQACSFQSAPMLLEHMLVDIGDRSNVLVIVVAVEPRFAAGEALPSLRVTCEDEEYHAERQRLS